MKTAPELLKEQMPLHHTVERNLKAYGYIKGTKEWDAAYVVEINFYRKFGNTNG